MIHLRVGKGRAARRQGYQRSYDQGQCDCMDQCEPLQSWLSGRADPCDANLAVPTGCAGRSFRMMGGSDGFAGTDKSRQLRGTCNRSLRLTVASDEDVVQYWVKVRGDLTPRGAGGTVLPSLWRCVGTRRRVCL